MRTNISLFVLSRRDHPEHLLPEVLQPVDLAEEGGLRLEEEPGVRQDLPAREHLVPVAVQTLHQVDDLGLGLDEAGRLDPLGQLADVQEAGKENNTLLIVLYVSNNTIQALSFF